MLFNSIEFVFFFVCVTTLYFACPHRSRWILLLGSSCIFYMAFVPIYILILAFTIVVDYFAGLLVEQSRGGARKIFLLGSLVANIGVLCIFKYYAFTYKNLEWLTQYFQVNNPLPFWRIVLPIGLSFHTFQAMSYTIEVYRGKQPAERNFGIYALYVMFYPQLVAGPIERPQNLLHQFREEHTFDYRRITDGLKLMAWGAFKKIVVADRLAMLVNPAFDSPRNFNGLQLALATVCFSYQIYCDFSGYSDIALGAAQVMGFRLMENFRRPYFASSIVEFWSRWHISLTTWFRDYVFMPLRGTGASRARWYINAMIVFLISGLWHGANWTFVAWGALHGVFYILWQATASARKRIGRIFGLERFSGVLAVLGAAVTFLIVSFLWIFFRANTITDACFIAVHLHTGWSSALTSSELQTQLGAFGQPLGQWVITLCATVALVIIELAQERFRLRQAIASQSVWVRWSIYYAGVVSIVFFGEFGKTQFIYFQF